MDEDKKIIFFPGEISQFDKNLLKYQIFSFQNNPKEEKQTLSSMKSVILYPDKLKNENKNKKKESNETNLSILYYGNYYSPREDDIIIGIITQKTFEIYKLDILANKEATLNSIDFEGATRKTKPNLNVGDAVYARVEKENKYSNATLSCKSLTNAKVWSSGESTYGELKDGKIYNIHRYLGLKLLKNQKFIDRLKECVDKLEIKIGYNGRIWIKTEKLNDNAKVFKAIMQGLSLNHEEREIFFNNLFSK